MYEKCIYTQYNYFGCLKTYCFKNIILFMIGILNMSIYDFLLNKNSLDI